MGHRLDLTDLFDAIRRYRELFRFDRDWDWNFRDRDGHWNRERHRHGNRERHDAVAVPRT